MYVWLDKALDNNEPLIGSAALYPTFEQYHSDPRWGVFLRKAGIAPEQLAAIKFDVKVPN
jgi:hypothetical protein